MIQKQNQDNLNGMIQSIQEGMKNIERMATLSCILQKEVLTLKEASLFTGYTESYLYKLNSTSNELPVYSSCANGKLFFKREELQQRMTGVKKNGYNITELQTGVDKYLNRKTA